MLPRHKYHPQDHLSIGVDLVFRGQYTYLS